MNCIVRLCCGPVGGSLLYGRFCMHSISGLSLALHWHLLVRVLQLHGSSQLGIVFSYRLPLNFPAFINVKHLDLVFDIRNFLIFVLLYCAY
jgi:hypothetical protein